MTNMNRDQARELLSDYLEGELPQRVSQELEALLAGDTQLRRELERLRKTLHSLSRLRALRPPPEFARRVERRIQLRSRGRFFAHKLGGRLPFEWFSFVIILVLLTLYLMVVLEGRQVRPTDDSANDPRPATTAIQRDAGPARQSPPARDATTDGNPVSVTDQ